MRIKKMSKYFGTDGIRGKANVTLTVETAFKIGRYLGYHFSKEKKAHIVIGKDTRLSSSMFECAIASGASSSGCDVSLVGYCPTPTIAYLTKNMHFDCGVMISASHNPYYDNGIKIFSSEGIKIDAHLEELIEAYIDDEVSLEYVSGNAIGKIETYSEGLQHYLDWLASLFPMDLSNFHIAIDCANGSSTTTALQLLTRLHANCHVINHEPNGININEGCGSTHPEALCKLVKEGKYDLGLAFDGDADRLIAVNEDGQLIDGDHILYICGKFLKENDALENNTVVTTVMANLGFFKAMERLQIDTKSTKVGDKYVYDCMVKEHFTLGGEQSGHIIFSNHATTGDGLLTALKLIEVMHKTSKSLKTLSEGLKIYPQLLVNVPVKDKEVVLHDEDVAKEIKDVTLKLKDNGRILVRPSGTEPLIRVMVEAETEELCHHYVYQVVDLIKQKNL